MVSLNPARGIKSSFCFVNTENSLFSELLVICDQKGFAEGAKFVAESKPKLNDREFHELLMIFKDYQFISEHPELQTIPKEIELLQPKTRMQSVRLDDVFRAETGEVMPRLWLTLIGLGYPPQVPTLGFKDGLNF